MNLQFEMLMKTLRDTLLSFEDQAPAAQAQDQAPAAQAQDQAPAAQAQDQAPAQAQDQAPAQTQAPAQAHAQDQVRRIFQDKALSQDNVKAQKFPDLLRRAPDLNFAPPSSDLDTGSDFLTMSSTLGPQAIGDSIRQSDGPKKHTRQPSSGLPPVKDASGRFTKRPISAVDGDSGASGLPAKVARKTPDDSKPIAYHAKLIAHRYPATKNESLICPGAFVKSGDTDQILKNIRSCVCFGLVGNEAALRNAVNIGLEIDAFIDIKKRVKNIAGKKPTTIEMYAQLGEALQMPGFEVPSSTWFYNRRALAKISECLQLEKYAYRLNIDKVIIMAPQLKKAKIIGLDFD